MKVQLPRIPAGLKQTSDNPAAFQPGARIERMILRNFEALNHVAQKMKLDEVALDRLTLVNTALDDIIMMDVEIRGCDLSAAVLVGGNFNRVRFTNCRMAGIDLSRAKLGHVTFQDCKLDMANFRFAKLDGVKFEDCTLVEADFQVSEIANVTFSGCTIESTIFDQCKASNVDARSSNLRDVHGWRYLRGFTLDHTQLVTIAPELARELGLSIQ